MRCRERVRTRNIPCDTSAHFPRNQRIPSVLFSSFKNRPVGSLEAGTPNRMHARKIMSFNILCLLVRPALLLHDNPWMPKASTIAPQGQPCGAHKFTPSLKPIATRTASSSSLKPQDETGMAFNQSPLCGACAASRRALLMSSEHDPKRHCRACRMEASSQDLCFDRTTGIWGWKAVFG